MNDTVFMLILACVLDRLIGDPRVSWHPVVLIGNLIGMLEKCLHSPNDTSWDKRIKGGLLVMLVLIVVYSAAFALNQLFALGGPVASLAGSALMLSFAVSPRSLAEAGEEIYGYLLSGDMAQARYKVGWIVGRDTNDLDASEVTRATVETIAENIVDGIISPLFFALLGGLPLAFLYRAINTMDSMLGYRNEKYIDFGKVAARLDDIANYIPARITGLLIIIAAAILRLDACRAWQRIRIDAGSHPSPNSGISEAGVAGALGIQLGGLNYYGGIASFRAYMGTPVSPLEPFHIGKTITIMYVATWTFLAGAYLLSILV